MKTAALATGLKRNSSVRSGQICAGVFHGLATEKVDASIQRPLAGGFKLLKRSKDESPVHSMDPETKTIMPSKVLNARMHFRQGFSRKDSEEMPIFMMGAEMPSNDARSMLDVFQRMSPATIAARLSAAARACGKDGLCLLFELGDQLTANSLMSRMTAFLANHNDLLDGEATEAVRLWIQRCESHVCNLVSTRPFDTWEIAGDVYCCARLLRQRHARKRLLYGMQAIARKELPNNVIYGRPPDQQSTKALDILINICVGPIMMWSEQAEESCVLGRLTAVKEIIRDNFEHIKGMFTNLSSSPCGHTCWLDGSPCCSSMTETLDKFLKAVAAIEALLPCGSADPQVGKWFSISFRIRGMLAAEITHKLFSRSWCPPLAVVGCD